MSHLHHFFHIVDLLKSLKNMHMHEFHNFPHRRVKTYLVLSGGHAIIDLFELAVMWAQEFEGLGYRGHGGG